MEATLSQSDYLSYYCEREYRRQVQERTEDVYLQGLTLTEDDSVLDVGCGGGQTLAVIAERFQARRLVGVDADPRPFAWATKHNAFSSRISFQEGSITALPFEAETFTVVLANRVLMHVPVSRSVAELCRILKPGGRLLIACTPWRHYAQQVLSQLGSLRIDRFSTAALLNGALLGATGYQLSLGGRYSSFQTMRGMRAELGKHNVSLSHVWSEKNPISRRWDLVLLARKAQ